MTMRLIWPILLLAMSTPSFAEPIRFARYPHISDQGRLAFSYHGDIWVANDDGSEPRRLTAHIARDTFPRFSPDGMSIAFNSDRMGNDDIFVIPVAGGSPVPITFHTTNDSVLYWTPDGKEVLFKSSRSDRAWTSPLYRVGLEGTLPEPLAMDAGAAGMISQDGKRVAFNRNGFRYWRKSYRGNNNTDIWVQDVSGGDIKQLTDTNLKAYRHHTQDAFPMWGIDGQIYFTSERGEGAFNIWKVSPEGGLPTQVTYHGDDGVQYPSISPSGRYIVYENNFEIWKIDVRRPSPQPIRIDFAFDPKDNDILYFSSDDSADGFSPSPDGDQVAVEYHGEIFVVPTDRELGEMSRVTNSGWRDRDPLWSPDGNSISYLSDASGEDELWIFDVGRRDRRQVTTHESSKSNVRWAPDSKSIFFVGNNKLCKVTLESGETVELNENADYGFRFDYISPKGEWVMYTRSDDDLNSDVYLFELATRVEHNLTRHLASDRNGELTPDRSTAIFSSDRDGSRHLYALSLAPLTEDPDDPLVRKRNKEQQSKKKDSKKKGAEEKDADKSDPDKPADDASDAANDENPEGDPATVAETTSGPAEPIQINFDDIDRRPRQITTGNNSVSSWFLSSKGDKIYYTDSSGLNEIGVDGRDKKQLTGGSFSNLTLTHDGKSFFYSSGNNVYRMSVSGSGKKKIEFDLKFQVDRKAEWAQMFREAWRIMKYRFYDPNMHGVNWAAMRDRYEPYLAYVGENQDLYDLCNEMIGELNASHTGVSGPATRKMDEYYSTRHLGITLVPGDGHYLISDILRDGPGDKEWLDLRVGDRVEAMDGEPLRTGDNYFARLNHLLNDYIELTVSRPDTKEIGSNESNSAHYSDPRVVRIKTTSSISTLKYRQWVHERRQIVDERSGGKIGYVHIKAMDRASLRVFEQEIDRYWNKNGMIVDIRYNGGGNIDQDLIDILERRPYEYWNHRWGARSRGRRPFRAIAGPKVMLINWRSASDSEVTPQAFRDLGLGRIVGNPTYGAVIATSSYGLINGGSIRTPSSLVVTYDPSKPNNYGINLENFGVAPDVWVENTPADELAGRDRELEAAVDEALRMLAAGTWQYGEDD